MGKIEHHHAEEAGSKNIRFAFFLNFAFSLIELAGGILTNSVAILSDAVHDFGDSISLGVSWFLQNKSQRKSDQFYSYGYKRFSLLGAIFISLVLLFSSFFIIRESIYRLIEPQIADAKGMILLAILGIAVNGFAAFRLSSGHSLNEKAVSVHLLEDVFGWVAVFVAGIIMLFADIPIIDPILSISISVWVLFNVYRNLRNTIRVLMQEVPQNVDVNSMLSEIEKIPAVIGLHDFHLWSLDGERNIMTIHIVTPNSISSESVLKLKQDIKQLAYTYHVEHVTLEFENEAESEVCEFRNRC